MSGGGTNRLRRFGRRLLRPSTVLQVIGWVALFSFFLWTSASTEPPFSFPGPNGSYFNLLADAFRHGHLHLLVKPDPRLLRLPDPYDPGANAPYRLHDMSLYHGRYYMQWGPVPALGLYLPFRLLGIGDMNDALACALFASIGSFFAIKLLWYITLRFLPRTPRWMLLLGSAAVVLGSGLPFMLRRTLVYEVSIAAAYAFALAGLYFLASGMLASHRSVWRLALSSALIGLSVGCRQTMLVVAVLPFASLGWVVWRDRPARGALVRLTLALGAPLAVCVLLLGLYNYFRFGSFTEIGQHYQLAGTDVRNRVYGSLSYVLPGSWYYLFARAPITATFPFFHVPPPPGSYPFTPPATWDGLEPTAGILTNVPIAVLALVTWPVLRKRSPTPVVAVATILSALGLGLVLLVSYSIWGATMRYEVDFATYLIIAGLLTWFALAQSGNRWVARVSKTLGAALVLWGALFGFSAGLVGYWNTFLTREPGQYDFLVRMTEPVGALLAKLEGKPAILRVAPASQLLAPAGFGTGPNATLGPRPLSLDVAVPSSGRYLLVAHSVGGSWKPGQNFCPSGDFERNAKGWAGYSGKERLTRVSSQHRHGQWALRVTIPDADNQGAVCTSSTNLGLSGGSRIAASGWMKGTSGTPLEFQVSISNTDGSTSGDITPFVATGGWQHETAAAFVNAGKTGSYAQILAIRRSVGGRASFLLDDAGVTETSSLTRVAVAQPQTGTVKREQLGAFETGIVLNLKSGTNRIRLTSPTSIELDNLEVVKT
jgi:hypothetical protein